MNVPGSTFPTGTPVEVWNRPLGRWGGTFEVAGTSPRGIEVRPAPGRPPLAGTYSADEVRPVGSSPPRTAGPLGPDDLL